jgi:hypothetical protein
MHAPKSEIHHVHHAVLRFKAFAGKIRVDYYNLKTLHCDHYF